MMKKSARMAILILAFLFTACFAQYQANLKDSLVLQQYLRQKGLSDTEIKNLRKSLDKRATAAGLQPKDTLRKDTTLLLDTAGVRKKFDSTAQLSIYENIIRNKTIDPDSLLRTLTVFGLDVFTGVKPSTFAPADYAATPADYIVGTGDEVIVMLWGRINEEYRLKVDREGNITIPRIGPLPVAGLPYSALQKNILDRVQKIEGVQTTVSLGELRSIGVFIVGEVKSPGYYTVSGLSNVTNALFSAGGPTRRGSLRNIQLKRGGNAIATIDFYDFLLSGSDNTRQRLKSGDVIMVPVVKKMVAIAGNVRRSALYEIKPSTTLKEALQLAGGVTPAAWTNRIQVERFKNNEFQAVLDLTAETPGAIPNFEVQDGDIIKIFPVVEKNKNAVYLSGNIMRPGKYEYKPGLRVSDVISNYHALLPETYFEYALVLRQEPPSFLNRLIPFNLKKALDDRASDQNIQLQPRDEVLVYSRDYFEPDRNVTIDGAVTNPGQQKLLENMKVRDLIIKAGGLTEEASPQLGELYRRTYNGEIVSTEKIAFCVSCALADDSTSNITLKKFDRVYIRNKKGWQDERRVVLKGEFVVPGEYVVLEKETLGEVIDRAGGFTSEAYLPAAVLMRVSVKQNDKARVEEYVNRLEAEAVKMTTMLATERGEQIGDATQLLAQQEAHFGRLKVLEPKGYVVIDFSKPSDYKDFLLEDGDTVYVPKSSGTVTVLGEVVNASTFRLEPDRKRAKHYLDLAGGFSQHADTRALYLYRANGTIITNRAANVLALEMGPGDALMVPEKIEYENKFKIFMDSVDAIFKIGSVLSIIITLLVVVNSTKK